MVGGLILAFLSLAIANDPETTTFFVHKKKYIMGTVFEIAAYDASPEHASEAIQKALEEVVRLDGVMSNYKPGSDLSRLNRNGHFHPETVSPDLYEAIRESLKYSRLSDGQFDITVAPLVDLWKAALGGGRAPSTEEQERLRDCVGYQKIQLLPPDRVKFHSPCMRIDLGSIGKGYAVDRAADILRSSGIKSALINAGESTIYGLGAPPGKKAWLVHLRDPSNKVDPEVLLYDNSVSTSEQTRPSLLGNDTAGHIIDPQTGRPVETACALSMVAKTGTASIHQRSKIPQQRRGTEPGRQIERQAPPGFVGREIHADGVKAVDVANRVVDVGVVRYGIGSAVRQSEKGVVTGIGNG